MFLNIDVVEETMNIIIARYDVLRTVFLDKGYNCALQLVIRGKRNRFDL